MEKQQLSIWYFLIAFLVIVALQEYIGPKHVDNLPYSDFSEETAREIDCAVRKIVESAFDKAIGILKQGRNLLDRGAQLLLQKETVNEEDLTMLREPQPVVTGSSEQSAHSVTGTITGMSI